MTTDKKQKKHSHRTPPKNAPKEVIIAAVVKEATRRYKRDVWWADVEDMSQHAWVVALEAHRTFKPERMDDFYWYAWRAVVVQLRNHLWRQSAPVSAPQRKLPELAGVFRDVLEAAPDVASEAMDADQRIEAEMLRKEVRQRALAIDPALALAALQDDDKALRRLGRLGAKDRHLATLAQRTLR